MAPIDRDWKNISNSFIGGNHMWPLKDIKLSSLLFFQWFKRLKVEELGLLLWQLNPFLCLPSAGNTPLLHQGKGRESNGLAPSSSITAVLKHYAKIIPFHGSKHCFKCPPRAAVTETSSSKSLQHKNWSSWKGKAWNSPCFYNQSKK